MSSARRPAPAGSDGLPASLVAVRGAPEQAVSELNEMGCAGFADVTAELALGVVTGRERAAALAHLDRCAACQENVRQLMMAGEGLMQLLPVREPPPGFETRVMERLGLAAPSPGPASQVSLPRGRLGFGCEPGEGGPGRARRVLAAAAVTLVAGVSALGGWGLGAATSSPARSSLGSAALLSASHQPVGTVFFSGGSMQWLSMSVSLRSGTGTVTCQLVSRDGHVVTLGSFWLDGGYGAWGSPGPVSDGQFTSARLVSTDGTVLATASFPRR
jgi:hypothetical protein